MRVLSGSDVVITSPTFVGLDGETPTDTASLPTVTVTNGAGTVLTSPTAVDTSDPGVYTTTLTYASHTPNVDTLTVTWLGTAATLRQSYRTTVEVVSSHYVSVQELRNEPDLDDASRFPASLIAQVRDEFEDTVERILGRAMVRRYSFETIDGTGTSELSVKYPWIQTVRSVSIDSVAKTASEFTGHVGGWVDWSGGAFPRPSSTSRNISIGYEHGEFDVCPPRLRREAIKCIRADLLSRTAKLPNQALSETFDGVTIRYSTPNPSEGRPTGVLSLDPVLVDLGIRPPGLA